MSRDKITFWEQKVHEANNLGDKKKTINACEEYIKLNEKNSYIYRILGMSYYKLGKLTESIKAYKKAIRLKPDSPDLHYSLGVNHYRYADFCKAIKSLRKCIKLDPLSYMALYWLV